MTEISPLPRRMIEDDLRRRLTPVGHDCTHARQSRQRAPLSYSSRPIPPEFNPIENAFAKLKALLRKAAARTLDQLHRAVAAGIDAFSLKDCANYFTAAGYEPK